MCRLLQGPKTPIASDSEISNKNVSGKVGKFENCTMMYLWVLDVYNTSLIIYNYLTAAELWT